MVTKNGPEKWKKCKILGSLLDTNKDIKMRKQLANNAMRKHIFNNNRLNIKTKIRIFNACVKSIFLYNSELWTLTKTAENKIDSYHQRLLRRAINIRWPNKISCEDLYNKTKQGKWSGKIKTRRMTCTTRSKKKSKATERRPNNNMTRSAGKKPRCTGPHSRWIHRTRI